jgi:transposase-like protein
MPPLLIRFVPLIDQEVRKRKKPVGSSWRMDETYITPVRDKDCINI